MQDNAPSLASGYSKVWLEDNGFCTNQLMQWPANSPDLNPIESPWWILKSRFYQIGRQYQSKAKLWKAIQNAAASVSSTMINNLKDSMDRRLIKVIENKGGHIKHWKWKLNFFKSWNIFHIKKKFFFSYRKALICHIESFQAGLLVLFTVK